MTELLSNTPPVIADALQTIERERGVRILFACESGSRAWGFESTDSDWDVRFICHHPVEAYLALDLPAEQLDHFADSAIGPLDVVGWDLRKTLRLVRKSNPSLVEWMHSPIRYAQLQPHADELRSLVVRAFSPTRSAYHYANMARSNATAVLSPERVVRKKYFYLLRPVLAYQWSLERRTVPPVLFEELFRALVPPESPLIPEVNELVASKRAGLELGIGARLPHLDGYLRAAYERMLENEIGAHQSLDAPTDAELNAFLRRVLS